MREAEAIGNDALVQQAKVRLADLDALLSGGVGRGPHRDPIPGPKPVPRRLRRPAIRGTPRATSVRWASVSCASVSIPVIRMVSRNSSSTMRHPSQPFTCASTAAPELAGQRVIEVGTDQLHHLAAGEAFPFAHARSLKPVPRPPQARLTARKCSSSAARTLARARCSSTLWLVMVRPRALQTSSDDHPATSRSRSTSACMRGRTSRTSRIVRSVSAPVARASGEPTPVERECRPMPGRLGPRARGTRMGPTTADPDRRPRATRTARSDLRADLGSSRC